MNSAPTPPAGPSAPALPRAVTTLRQRYVVDLRRDVDAASDAARSSTSPARVAFKAAAVLLTATVSLLLINFLSDASHPSWLTTMLGAVGLDGLAARVEHALVESDHRQFNGLAFWTLVRLGGYVLLPVTVVKLVLREPLRAYAVKLGGIRAHWPMYAILLALVLPLVVAASFTGPFQRTYPFYDLGPGEGLWPYLWWWWGLYAAQFVALEFFFRGFLLHGTKERLGYAALFVMIVPYVMIHFQKPMLEAIGAIGGGFVLGTMSLRTGSIWWGAALHVAVAGVMDLLALGHAGLLL